MAEPRNPSEQNGKRARLAIARSILTISPSLITVCSAALVAVGCAGTDPGEDVPGPVGAVGSSTATDAIGSSSTGPVAMNSVAVGNGTATPPTSDVSAVPSDNAPPLSSGTASGAPTDTPPVIDNPQVSDVCPTPQLGATPLRRLTRYEYQNSVNQLLGTSVDVVKNFPPDEMVNGFTNNAQILTVGEFHIEQYTLASEELAKAAVQNITTLAPCAMGTAEGTCARDFAKKFGRLAFRHTLSSGEEDLLMTAYAAGATDGSYAEGIEVMIRAALQSPNFLYRVETIQAADATSVMVPLTPVELATRLSYTLWASGPDDALLTAAESGNLGSKEQIAAQARVMLADPKAHAGIAQFYNQWFGTSKLDTITKSATFFPNFDASVVDGLKQEMNAFVDYVLWTGDHKFNTLLTAPVVFATDATAGIYGATSNGMNSTAQLITPAESQGRAGILTMASFLSVQAHPDQTSPVLRGKFIRTALMCDPPPRPPDNVDITPPEPGEAATARDRLSLHLSAGSSCAGCHEAMDPIGFAFENFDATGQWRAEENGVTIDATGEIMNSVELGGSFVGVRALAEKLVTSDEVQDCVATQWFRFAAGRTETTSDACSLASLQESFSGSDGDLVELIVSLTQTDAFLNRAQVVTQ